MTNEEVVIVLQTLLLAVGNCRTEREALKRAIEIIEGLETEDDD